MSTSDASNPQQVLHFWFQELGERQWFVADAGVDAAISEGFTDLHAQAVAGELFDWRRDVFGRLAEIIVLDQFSRNLFRDTARAFASDATALVLAQECVLQGMDEQLDSSQRGFLYMPFMHSESALMHELAVTLFAQPGMAANYDFELKHKAIIDQFGRYPHRNVVLGRESSDAELNFLDENPDF
jgi:uncharacterized protein (DUF924 family)